MFKYLLPILLSLSLAAPVAAQTDTEREDAERDAFELADDICRQNFEFLRNRFSPDLWGKSREELPRAQRYCPETGARKELVGFEKEDRDDAAGIFDRETYTVVAHDKRKWTMFRFVMQSSKQGAWQVVSWNVSESATDPMAEQRLRDAQFERAMARLGWFALGILASGAAAIGGLLWYFRRQHYKERNAR